MLKRLIVSGIVVTAVLGFSVCGGVPVHAGGMVMPEVQEEEAAPAAEPVQKMPVFEYEAEEVKMPVDEQPQAAVGEKTWVWVVLGFVAAVFLTSL